MSSTVISVFAAIGITTVVVLFATAIVWVVELGNAFINKHGKRNK